MPFVQFLLNFAANLLLGRPVVMNVAQRNANDLDLAVLFHQIFHGVLGHPVCGLKSKPESFNLFPPAVGIVLVAETRVRNLVNRRRHLVTLPGGGVLDFTFGVGQDTFFLQGAVVIHEERTVASTNSDVTAIWHNELPDMLPEVVATDGAGVSGGTDFAVDVSPRATAGLPQILTERSETVAEFLTSAAMARGRDETWQIVRVRTLEFGTAGGSVLSEASPATCVFKQQVFHVFTHSFTPARSPSLPAWCPYNPRTRASHTCLHCVAHHAACSHRDAFAPAWRD